MTVEHVDGDAVLRAARQQREPAAVGGLAMTVQAGREVLLLCPLGEAIGVHVVGRIEDNIIIRVQGKHGSGAKLVVQAPRSVRIKPP